MNMVNQISEEIKKYFSQHYPDAFLNISIPHKENESYLFVKVNFLSPMQSNFIYEVGKYYELGVSIQPVNRENNTDQFLLIRFYKMDYKKSKIQENYKLALANNVRLLLTKEKLQAQKLFFIRQYFSIKRELKHAESVIEGLMTSLSK